MRVQKMELGRKLLSLGRPQIRPQTRRVKATRLASSTQLLPIHRILALGKSGRETTAMLQALLTPARGR
jgi:hypothetical protein